MAGYKLKNKSSAKKRFKFSATGKVIITRAFKRHNLRKRSVKARRQSGTAVACYEVARIIKKYLFR